MFCLLNMEIFRGLRDIEKHLLKFLPNRDVVRLKRVCKVWQNMLNSIELDRIQRLPAEFRGIWRNMIIREYDTLCVLFLMEACTSSNTFLHFNLSAYDTKKCGRVIINSGSQSYYQILSNGHEIPFNNYHNREKWLLLFPEDK